MKRLISGFLAFLIMISCVIGALTVSAAGEYSLIVDPGFEDNDDMAWIKYVAAYLEFSEDAYEGEYSLLITDRRHSTDVVRQYVTNQLEFYGAGKYKVEAYVKLNEEGEAPVKVQAVLGAYSEDGSKKWATSEFVSVTSDKWTKVGGVVDVKWSGTLAEAEFYFITDEKPGGSLDDSVDYGFAEILIDACVLEPVDYKGEVYSTPKPTEKPTAAPTVKPTQKPAATATADNNADNNVDNNGAADNAGNSGNVNNGGAVALSGKQTVLIGVTAIAIGAVLAGCGIALLVAYRKDKKK